jgi:glycosyltransferase involved in cell wall biosynthesis
MPSKEPLVSIIIATHNVGNLIEKTLLSIFNQSYKKFEIIIIDAVSNDLTLSYIEKYKSRISYLISEPDKGIYDAWNKGLEKAKGEWIAFLGAGDEYLPDALLNYFNLLARSHYSVEFISSTINIVDRKGEFISVKGKPWTWPKFLESMMCTHVGSLHSRRLFEKYGFFDPSYKIAGDYEFLLRAGDQLKTAFLPVITINMLNGGVSTSPMVLLEDRRLKISTGKKAIWKADIEFAKNWLKQLARRTIEFRF